PWRDSSHIRTGNLQGYARRTDQSDGRALRFPRLGRLHPHLKKNPVAHRVIPNNLHQLGTLAISGNGLQDRLNHGDDVLDVEGPIFLGLLKVLHRLQLVQDGIPLLLTETDDVAELELLITGNENERVELLLD